MRLEISIGSELNGEKIEQKKLLLLPSLELVPKFIDSADLFVEATCFFIELNCPNATGPGPTVSAVLNLVSEENCTRGCVERCVPLNTCFPNAEVLLGHLKSEPPFEKSTSGLAGTRLYVGCRRPKNGFAFSVFLCGSCTELDIKYRFRIF